MKKITLCLLTGLLFICIESCDPCLGTGYSCADPFSFRLIDKITQQDLVFSPTPVYPKDSVYLTTTLQGYTGPQSYTDSNKFNSMLLIPLDTFYLRISATDTDTLLMSYHFVKEKCCNYSSRGFGKLFSIKYNGVVAPKSGETYLFKK